MEQVDKLSEESEEDEWQRWDDQHTQQQPHLAVVEVTREQQRRRMAHKLQHRARKWLELALGLSLSLSVCLSRSRALFSDFQLCMCACVRLSP